jgi:hypothetical protein
MHLVQLLLPVRDPSGRPFKRQVFEGFRSELTERFGGVTAFLRAPAEGLWRDDEGALEPDEVVILEVMCEELDRTWWASYRERLAGELEQKELVVRAIPIETL